VLKALAARIRSAFPNPRLRVEGHTYLLRLVAKLIHGLVG